MVKFLLISILKTIYCIFALLIMEPATFSPRAKSKKKLVCVVNGCNSASNKDENIRFHYFPMKTNRFVCSKNLFGQIERKDQLEVWMKILKIKEVNSGMKVCSLHFCKDDYMLPNVAANRRRLKTTAVPSLNLPQIQNTTSKDRNARVLKRNLIKIKVQKNLNPLTPYEDALFENKYKTLNISTDEVIGINADEVAEIATTTHDLEVATDERQCTPAYNYRRSVQEKKIRHAQSQRKYRERKRAEKELPPKVSKTNAERQKEYRDRAKERTQTQKIQKTVTEFRKEYRNRVELTKQKRLKNAERQRGYRERQKLRKIEAPSTVITSETNVSLNGSDEFTISEESGSGSYPIEYPESVILTDIKEEFIDPDIDEQKVQITVNPINIKQEFESPDIQETLTIKTEFIIPEKEYIKPIVSIKAELLTSKTEEVMIDDTYHPEFEPVSLTNGCDFVSKIREDKGCQFSTRWEEGFFETIFVCNRLISEKSSHAETQMDTVNIKTPNSYSNSKK